MGQTHWLLLGEFLLGETAVYHYREVNNSEAVYDVIQRILLSWDSLMLHSDPQMLVKEECEVLDSANGQYVQAIDFLTCRSTSKLRVLSRISKPYTMRTAAVPMPMPTQWNTP